jgi:hypothetical protein
MRFIQTFQFLQVPLAWYMFTHEPSAYMRKRMLLAFSIVVSGFYLYGYSLWFAICFTYCLFEFGVRFLISL